MGGPPAFDPTQVGGGGPATGYPPGMSLQQAVNAPLTVNGMDFATAGAAVQSIRTIATTVRERSSQIEQAIAADAQATGQVSQYAQMQLQRQLATAQHLEGVAGLLERYAGVAGAQELQQAQELATQGVARGGVTPAAVGLLAIDLKAKARELSPAAVSLGRDILKLLEAQEQRLKDVMLALGADAQATGAYNQQAAQRLEQQTEMMSQAHNALSQTLANKGRTITQQQADAVRQAAAAAQAQGTNQPLLAALSAL